jgi:hypothetical protein
MSSSAFRLMRRGVASQKMTGVDAIIIMLRQEVFQREKRGSASLSFSLALALNSSPIRRQRWTGPRTCLGRS